MNRCIEILKCLQPVAWELIYHVKLYSDSMPHKTVHYVYPACIKFMNMVLGLIEFILILIKWFSCLENSLIYTHVCTAIICTQAKEKVGFSWHYSNIRFRIYQIVQKSDYFMFLLKQILVNSHWELNLMCTSKKNKCKSKKWLGL